jgi:hypothetical protein
LDLLLNPNIFHGSGSKDQENPPNKNLKSIDYFHWNLSIDSYITRGLTQGERGMKKANVSCLFLIQVRDQGHFLAVTASTPIPKSENVRRLTTQKPASSRKVPRSMGAQSTTCGKALWIFS